MKATVNGKEIEYGDCIHHKSITKGFSMVERIRFLFGKPITVVNEIYVENINVKVVTSTAKTFIEPIFPKRYRKHNSSGYIISVDPYSDKVDPIVYENVDGKIKIVKPNTDETKQ